MSENEHDFIYRWATQNEREPAASVTEPAEGTGEQRRALLARQERYSDAVYGDGRGVTERVRAIMAIADAEVRAATKAALATGPETTIERLEAEAKARLLEVTTERYEHDAEVATLRGQLQAALGEVVRLEEQAERRTDVLASLDGTVMDQEATISLLRVLLKAARDAADLADDAGAAVEITHGTPCCGRQTTPCCDKSPFDLPRMDRMTLDPTLVTCIQAALNRRAQ